MTWPYLFHLVFSSLLSSFFLTLSSFLSSTPGKWIKTHSRDFTSYMSEYFWASALLPGPCRQKHKPKHTAHTHTCWVVLVDIRFIQVHQHIQCVHTHTVGKWLWALFTLTLTSLCVLSCHHFNLPLIVLLCVCVFVCVSFSGPTFMCHGAVGACTCEFVCLCCWIHTCVLVYLCAFVCVCMCVFVGSQVHYPVRVRSLAHILPLTAR